MLSQARRSPTLTRQQLYEGAQELYLGLRAPELLDCSDRNQERAHGNERSTVRHSGWPLAAGRPPASNEARLRECRHGMLSYSGLKRFDLSCERRNL